MLQQNFMSPEALGLTASQHRALVLTLNALERGELTHTPKPMESAGTGEYSGLFNMASWNISSECGTVCCIAGTAELLGNLPVNSLERAIDDPRSSELFNLFYAVDESSGAPIYLLLEAIKPAQAAKALRGYLTSGVADWSTT